MTHHGVGNQGQAAGGLGCGNGGGRAVEIRVRDTAALARPAIVTRSSPIQWHRQMGGPANSDNTTKLLLDSLSQHDFAASHGHGRQEFTIGQLRHSFGRSADSDNLFDFVIPGSQLGVTDGPIVAVAVAAGRFEIKITQPIALPAPNERTPSQNAKPEPVERFVWRSRVRVFMIVDEPFIVVFHTGITTRLDRPGPDDFGERPRYLTW